jgi:hypothetical protein
MVLMPPEGFNPTDTPRAFAAAMTSTMTSAACKVAPG